MKKSSFKTGYIQPSVKVVEFKVEIGLIVSPPPIEDNKAHTDVIVQGDAYESGYFDYNF